METKRQGQQRRATWIEVVIAGVAVVGVGLALLRASVMMNNGALVAPALAGVLVLGIFGARAFVPDGRARTMLTLVGRGLLLVGLLFLALLVLLLIALSNRGE